MDTTTIASAAIDRRRTSLLLRRLLLGVALCSMFAGVGFLIWFYPMGGEEELRHRASLAEWDAGGEMLARWKRSTQGSVRVSRQKGPAAGADYELINLHAAVVSGTPRWDLVYTFGRVSNYPKTREPMEQLRELAGTLSLEEWRALGELHWLLTKDRDPGSEIGVPIQIDHGWEVELWQGDSFAVVGWDEKFRVPVGLSEPGPDGAALRRLLRKIAAAHPKVPFLEQWRKP